MDYLKQLNAFYSQLEYNPVSANAISLWQALMHIANKTRWLEYFTVANKTLELKAGLEISSLQRARNELVQRGLLVYVKGERRTVPARYNLVVLYEQPSEHPSEHIIKHKTKDIKHKTKDINTLSGDPTVHEQIISHLNNVCGTNYRPTTKATVKLIDARLNECHRLDDFIAVIDKKYAEWHDKPDMVQYLRPETLFGTKFEGYLNQPKTDGKSAPVKKTKFTNIDSHERDYAEIERLELEYLQQKLNGEEPGG